VTKIERGRSFHVRRQITERLEGIEDSAIVLGEASDAIGGGVVLGSDGSITITPGAGALTISVDPNGVTITDISLSDLLANFRRLLVSFVETTGTMPEGLESEYDTALGEL